MATPPTPQPTATAIWIAIKKEITGIQLLWETVNNLYWQPAGKEWRAFASDAPLLVHLTQTAMVESLLMRVSRLMDPAEKGNLKNLSLKRLVVADASVAAEEQVLRTVWEGSGLVDVRNKYLSHNDLHRSLNEEHTLNIPLEPTDVAALGQLAEGLRTLRRNVNSGLGLGAYVDQDVDTQVTESLKVLAESLRARNHFYSEFAENPESACLQKMLREVEHG